MIRCKFFKTSKGFTFIEVIIAIVMAALFGSMLFQFMNSSVISSSDEVVMVQQGYDLIGIMEQMTADYDELIKTDSDPLTTFKGYIEENTPDYGDYTFTTDYIKFTGDDLNESDLDVGDDNNFLKVTIKKGSQSLTALFSQKTDE